MRYFGCRVFKAMLSALLFPGASSGSAAETRVPTPTPNPIAASYTVNLPGPPFGVVATRDQKSVFVSLAGRRDGKPIGVAVLQAENGRYSVVRVVPTPAPPTGIVLSHDEKILVAATGDSVVLLDANRMTRGDRDAVVTRFSYDQSAGSVYVNVTPDDRTLFVSDEQKSRITVIDLANIRTAGFTPAAVLGRIPVGIAPIALTFSPDGQWLYTTSQRAPPDWGWAKNVRREGASGDAPAPLVPEGAVIVFDVKKARTDPAHAIVARVPAGGSPVRLAISPAGDRVYVTARNDHALRVFDAAKLRAGAVDAQLAAIPVGNGPVPVVVTDEGRTILVGNSNRFGAAPDAPSSITVIAADKISEGPRAVVATISAGAFPREFHLAADGRTLFLTNFRSLSLLVLDAQRLSVERGRE